ncbi:MAG: hypothetical protein AB7I41_11755 [Candidatus Sericytochromatia bacterium]
MKKSLSLLLGFCLCFSLFQGCASSQQPSRKPLPQLDLPNQKGQIEQTARQFIGGFYNKNQEQVLGLSGYPFYMDDGGLLTYPQEWKAALDYLFAIPTPYPHHIKSLQIMTGPEIPSINTQVWSRLLELRYHQKIYVYADVVLTTPQGPFSEKVLLILDRDPDDLSWKVLGFFS